MSETLKKYGVWIAAGALVLYLLYKNMGRGGARVLPSASGESGLDAERLRQSGNLALQRAQLDSNLELARLKAAQDRYNAEQQALARRRAEDLARRQQDIGLIGSILNGIGNLLKGGAGQQRPGTPPTFPGGSGGIGGQARTQPQLPPYYPIPEPRGIDINPPFYPEYPVITEYPLPVTDWGEAPQFEMSGTTLDTGGSFFDQWGGDWVYGVGYGAESQLPELSGEYVPAIGSEYGDWDLYDFLEAGATPMYGGAGGGASYDPYADWDLYDYLQAGASAATYEE